MGVSILIVTHGDIGQSIADMAIKIIGLAPMKIEIISVNMDDNPEPLITKIDKIANRICTDAGLLILTDLFGATPSNIATASNLSNCVVVAGLNLPMLIRVMNYHTLPLFELCDKAVDGGKDGVLSYYLEKNEKNATNEN